MFEFADRSWLFEWYITKYWCAWEKSIPMLLYFFFLGEALRWKRVYNQMERSFTLWVLILQITFGEASSERSTGGKPCCWPSHDPCGQRSCREHVACISSIPAQQIETDMFFYSRWVFQIQKEWTEVLHLPGGTPKPMHSDTSKVWRGAWLGWHLLVSKSRGTTETCLL